MPTIRPDPDIRPSVTPRDGPPDGLPDELDFTTGNERFPYLAATPARLAAPELLAMLRRLEWSHPVGEGADGWCPVCLGREPDPPYGHRGAGHAPNCSLAALLARASATP